MRVDRISHFPWMVDVFDGHGIYRCLRNYVVFRESMERILLDSIVELRWWQ